MKKFILLFFLSVGFISLKGQETYYKALITELYTYNEKTKNWDLHTKNSNSDIRIVLEDEFITFQAKSPSMYKIYTTTKKTLETKSMKGLTYDAKDLKHDEMVTLDILREKDGDVAMISIVNQTRGINVRFFLIVD
jgi:hypothetical protein